MKYLLDVNALVALGVLQHEFHSRVANWVRSLRGQAELLTCSITELGFVRILANVSQYDLSLSQAQYQLLRAKGSRAMNFVFIADGNDATHLPAWVKTARQLTDGHLAELAREHGAMLATLDERIPRSFLIPQLP